MFLYNCTGGIIIKRFIYVNGNERFAVENIEHFKVLVNAGKITKDTFLLDEETQAWVGVLQIPEFGQFFMSNTGSQYMPNQQYQQQSNPQNYQNTGINQNQGFNPNQNYNQAQGFNYNVNYPQPPKKKGKVVAIILAIVFVVAGLGAGAYFLFLKDSDKGTTYGQKIESTKKAESTKKVSKNKVTHEQEVQATKKIVSLASNFSSGSGSLSPKLSSENYEDEYGGLYPIVEATEKYYMEIQKGKEEAEKAIQDLTSESVFTKEILSDSGKLSEAKSKIKKFITVITDFEELIISSTEKFQKTIQDADIPSSFKSGFLDGFEKGNSQTMDLLKRVFNAYETALTKFSDLFTFLQSRQGDYKVSEDATISFYTDEDKDTYNKIFTEMQEASEKGDQLQKELEDKSKKAFGSLDDFAD